METLEVGYPAVGSAMLVFAVAHHARFTMNRLLATLAIIVGVLGVLPSSACAQSGAISGGSFSVVDGVVALNGTFENLRAIEVASSGGFLDLPNISEWFFPIFDRTPLHGGRLWENNKNRVVIENQVGWASRVDIADITRTAIRFTESAEVAAGDLSLNVAVGYCDSVDVPLSAAIDFVCDATRGDIAPDASFSIVDGRVTLNGFIRELSSIQVQSNSSELSIASGWTIFSKAPFDLDANLVRNTPDEVSLGVLGADKAIGVEAPVVTAIEYGGDASAIQGDLEVKIWPDGGPPPPFGGPGSTPPFSIVDGRLTLGVDINDLSFFEVLSRGGFLSMATISVDRPGAPSSTAPFVAGDVISNSPTEVLLRAENNGAVQSVSGVTPTSILYDGARDTFTDLVVTVTTASGEQARIPYVVPEPSTFCGLIVGLSFVASFRRRR